MKKKLPGKIETHPSKFRDFIVLELLARAIFHHFLFSFFLCQLKKAMLGLSSIKFMRFLSCEASLPWVGETEPANPPLDSLTPHVSVNQQIHSNQKHPPRIQHLQAIHPGIHTVTPLSIPGIARFGPTFEAFLDKPEAKITIHVFSRLFKQVKTFFYCNKNTLFCVGQKKVGKSQSQLQRNLKEIFFLPYENAEF